MLGDGFTSTVVARVVAAAIQAAEGQVGVSAFPVTHALPCHTRGKHYTERGYDTQVYQPQAAPCQLQATPCQPQAAPCQLDKLANAHIIARPSWPPQLEGQPLVASDRPTKRCRVALS